MTHEDGEESQMPFEQEQSASLHIGSRADGHARQHNGNVYGDVHSMSYIVPLIESDLLA